MTPERLNDLRSWAESLQDYMDITRATVCTLIAEIDRLRAPVEDVEVSNSIQRLRLVCECPKLPDWPRCARCETADLIARLAKELVDARAALIAIAEDKIFRVDVDAARVRAEAAEAEVTQLKAECCRCGEPTTAVCKAAQTAEAEVEKWKQDAAWDKAAASDFLGRAEAAEAEVAAFKKVASAAGKVMQVQLDELTKAEAEVARLKHDIARHIEITSDQCELIQEADAQLAKAVFALNTMTTETNTSNQWRIDIARATLAAIKGDAK